MASEGLPVQLACRVLGVSESGYYDALSRPRSARVIRHAWLTDQIREVHMLSNGTYGARRVHAEAGICGVTGRPRWRRPRPELVSKDLVDRDFARSGWNQLWVTDITEHPTREGKVYCAVPRRLLAASRRLVGRGLPDRGAVTNALGMAIDPHTPPQGAVIQPDRGVQFASWAFTDRAKALVCCLRWAAWPTASTTR